MIKMIVGFVALFLIFFVGLGAFQELSGKEKWVLTKSILYSIMCATATIGLIAVIIFLF